MESKTNLNIQPNTDMEYDELDAISENSMSAGVNYLGDSRYAIIGNSTMQWNFVHSLREICRERFNEPEFEPGLLDGDGFTVFNKKSKGATIIFKGEQLHLSAEDVGFIVCYRLSLAKGLDKVSEAMYQNAKTILTPECFKEFFEMIDWKKINFYSLFEITQD
jgi:hypothetical protein